ETQIKAQEANQYLEWIPLEDLISMEKSDISEAGPADTWDPNENKFTTGKLIKVALISIGDSPESFLKEFKIHYHGRTRNGLVVRLFGATCEPVTNKFMMVAETVEWDLRHYMSHHFVRLTWLNKIAILYTVACALGTQKNGLQQNDYSAANKTVKSHIEIPLNELGLDDEKELIPVIGNYHVPECYKSLIKLCWSQCLDERPTISDLINYFNEWHLFGKDKEQFEEAEQKRVDWLLERRLDPSKEIENPPKIHSQAIYGSRTISIGFLIGPGVKSLAKKCKNISKNDDDDDDDVTDKNEHILKQYELTIPDNPTIGQKWVKKDRNNDDYLILKLNNEETIFVFSRKKIVTSCQEVGNYIQSLIKKRKTILFLATKKTTRDIVKEAAIRCDNFQNLVKKEQVSLEKRRNKLQSIYEGVVNLYRQPDALFIIGLNKEKTAFKEAKKVGLPVIAVCNTNCNPRLVDYVIPGNDESVKSVTFFVNLVADAISEIKKGEKSESGIDKEKSEVK
ncbi:4755_t:CDS:2, partial [Scutellospora calospora]